MNGSLRTAGVGLIVALVPAIAGTLVPGTEGSAASADRSSVPNWEHIRIVGAKLGVPRALSVGPLSPRSVAVGDFDGDGDADIAVVTGAAGRAVVFLGDGSGRFGRGLEASPEDWPTIEAVAEREGIAYRARSSALSSSTDVQVGADLGQRSRSAATHLAVVADFDGNGIVDVVASAAGSTSLVTYLGRAAGGSSPAHRVALDAPPKAMASGDFDGDSRIDLVVADGRSSLVTLLFGDGRGAFSRSRSAGVGIRSAPGGLAASDIDADGFADLVVVGERWNDVKVLAGTGSGSFTLLDSIAVDDLAPSTSSVPRLSADATEYQGILSLALNPATIAGGSGATATGTITLNAPAPASGVVVTLTSSNPELAASAPSITVPAGASTSTFIIGTNANYRRYSGLAFSVTISAAHGTTTASAALSVTAQPQPGTLSSFDAQNQGQMCFGVGVRRTQTGPALEFGSAGNLFDCVPPDNPVGQDGICTFRQECSLGCEMRPVLDGFRFSDACATTGPFPLAVNPKLLVGGNPSVATLQLNAAAPVNSSGVLSSGTVLANTIPNISTPIPQGAMTASADVLTARVNSPQFAPIDGSYFTPRADGSRSGRIGLRWVTLVPGTPPSFQLTSFTFDPSSLTSVVGGATLFAFAQMNQVAPAPEIASATMTVSSSNPSAASIAQPEVTFTQGSSNAGVGIQTHAVSADTVVTISARLGATTVTRQLTVRATPAATRVSSFFLDPLEVTGGNLSTGTVVLDGSAPSGGAVVTLHSSDTAVATMPASVTVPAASDRVSFTVATSPVASSTTVTLNANYNGAWAVTSLIVSPSPGAALLASLAVSPTSVAGGKGATGTVTLTAAASNGGALVSLSSSSSVATVPASVTVPAGAQSATFGVATSAVTASTPVTITGTSGGVTRTASLTVTPPATTVTLSVTATGRSGERVSSSPAGISVSVGATGSATFASGTSVTLSVSNGRDAIWSGACSSGGNKTKTCTLTLSASASVTANVQ